MKTLISKTTFILFVSLVLSGCHKSYTCECIYNGRADVTIGEVKAANKEKALEKCPQGGCPGGELSVK